MNVSRPLGNTALIIIGLCLLVLTALLMAGALSDGRSLVARREGGPPRVGPSLEPTRPERDALTPVPVAPTTAEALEAGTPGAAPSPQAVTPIAADSSPTTGRPVVPGPADTEPMPTVRPLPEESPALRIAVAEWQRVHLAELGVAFEVPAAWSRLGSAWAWSPDGEGAPHVGFKWSQDSAPSEMVPTPSVVTAIKPVNLGWVEGRSYQVEVLGAGAVVAVEKHVVVPIDTDLSADFYISGRSTADLAALDHVLLHVLSTITYQAVPDGPVEVSVQFLTALLEDPSGERATSFLSPRLQGGSPMSLLRIEGMYSSFSVLWSAVADGRIQVLATLRYPGNRVEQRILNLIKQDGGWRIDEITSAS